MIRCVRCSSCVVADYVAVGMMRTVLPFYAKKLGGGAVLIGSLEALYGVGQVIGALTLGRLSDKKGRRFVLAISFFGSIIGYTMAGFATTPAMLLASRLPVGLAKQTVTIARAIVADCTAEGDRSKWMAAGTSIQNGKNAKAICVAWAMGDAKWQETTGCDFRGEGAKISYFFSYKRDVWGESAKISSLFRACT